MALYFDTHRGSFDGVDIDWEYPVYGGPPEIGARLQDWRNMTLLARGFRRQLQAQEARAQTQWMLAATDPVGGTSPPTKSPPTSRRTIIRR